MADPQALGLRLVEATALTEPQHYSSASSWRDSDTGMLWIWTPSGFVPDLTDHATQGAVMGWLRQFDTYAFLHPPTSKRSTTGWVLLFPTLDAIVGSDDEWWGPAEAIVKAAEWLKAKREAGNG